ncbi:hypothetical protein [Blautia sp. An46]|uniref:hypothetical protein n=1 Tax=Blautia sp. An46 TaxID=1965636 RepID=UPI000B39067A|nr:hypothetical protein [Blautia sp. An46]OUN91877.1 hypothetical protein B5G00_10955 [Blautia sp. An46]OUP00786.1 hypothetical protein B5F37_09720 [Drancourtella sp. An210]
MSAIIFLPGRPTSDPQIMQAKNSNTTYTTLDISCPQRGADGKKETVFYSCYFNSFLADRLIKAGVKKSTGLIIIGELELHPFIHQKGKNQGKPNSGPSVVVKDWQFAPMTYDDANGANPGVPGGVPQNGYGQPGGAPVPNQQGGYPTPAQGGYPQASGAPAGNYAPTGAAPQNQNGYARGGQGRTTTPQGNVPQNGYRQPQNGYTPNPGNAPNYAQGNPNQQPSGGYAPASGAAPGTQGGYPGDGFTQVTEQQAETLPFVA